MTAGISEWSALCAAPPPVGAGVEMRPGLRFVTEIAKIGLAQVQGAPFPTPGTRTLPVWVDATSRVVSVQLAQGTPAGAESGWPPATATVTVKDLQATAGMDFTDVNIPDTRLAAGSLIRWGLRTATTWAVIFTGYIDLIEEDDLPEYPAGGPRLATLGCVDTTWFLAGINNEASGASNSYNIPVTLSVVLENLLSSENWPFARWVNPTAVGLVANTVATGNQLAWAHRFADSYGHVFYAGADGAAYCRAVGVGVEGAEFATLSDRPTLAVAGHADLVGGVPARAHWTSSPLNATGYLIANYVTGLTNIVAGTNARLQSKFVKRYDPNGWPKMNLLTDTNANIQSIVNTAQPRYDDELALDRLSIDTQHGQPVWDFVAAPAAYLRAPVTYQRRRFGPGGWIEKTMYIVGLSWIIEPQPARIRVEMFTRDRI